MKVKKKIFIILMLVFFIASGIILILNKDLSNEIYKFGGILIQKRTENVADSTRWDISADDGESDVWAEVSEDGTTLTITGKGAISGFWNSNLPSVGSENRQPWYNSYGTIITKINIKEGITFIDTGLFRNMSNVTEIEMPASLIEIYDRYCNPFLTNESLKNIVINEGNENYKFQDGFLIKKKDKKIIAYARGCEETERTIPEDVATIGERAIYRPNNLQRIIIHEDVEEIEGYGIYECGNLSQIIIANENIIIGDYAINLNNDNICTIYGISGSTAETYANKNSDMLTFDGGKWTKMNWNKESVSLQVGEETNIALIGTLSIENEEIEVEITKECNPISDDESIVMIKDYKKALGVAAGETTLWFDFVPSAVATLPGLLDVTVQPNGQLDELPDELKENLTATYGQTLADVELPEGFEWEDELSTKVGNAGKNIFTVEHTESGATGIQVTIEVAKADPEYTVPTGLVAAYGQYLMEIELPEGFSWEKGSDKAKPVGENNLYVKYTPSDTYNYNEITEIQVTLTVVTKWNISADDGESEVYAELLEDGKTFKIYGHGATYITAESGWISNNWGDFNSNITTVIIDEGITEIGASHFKDMSVQEVEIPVSLTSFGNNESYIFRDCNNLKNINIAEGNEYYEFKDGFLISKQSKNVISYAKGNAETEIIIPEDVVAIKEYAFYEYNELERLTISENVEEIEEDGIYNCDNLSEFIILNDDIILNQYCMSKSYNSTVECIIYGFAGSSAQTYAEANEITFKEIKNINDLAIELGTEQIIYDGTAKTPEIIVKDGETILVEDKDYTVECLNNINAGEATAEITAKGIYTGTVTKTFTIQKANPEYTVPTGLKAKYGQTLQDVSLPAGFSWEDEITTSVGKIGTNVFNVTYTPEDINNYNIMTGIQVEIVVEESEYKGYEIDEENGIISKILPGTKAGEFISSMANNENYEIKNNQGEIIQGTDKIGTGYKLKVADGKEYTLVVYGDLNGDADINILDVARLQKVIVKTTAPTNLMELASDLRNDSEINIIDLARLQKLVTGQNIF